jgi:dihydroflavonol-4-reductase
VKPAVEGTSNIMHEAFKNPKIRRVVLTSSIVTTFGSEKKNGIYTEEGINENYVMEENPYNYSKVKAEQKAWELVKNFNRKEPFDLVVVVPGHVIGPPVLDQSSFSLDLITAYLSGEQAAIDLTSAIQPSIDVRDLANIHIQLFENKECKGRYLSCHANSMSLLNYANILKVKFPKYNVTPGILGDKPESESFDNHRVKELIGELISVEESLFDMGNVLIEMGLVKKIE